MKEIVYIVEDDFDIGELVQYLLTDLGKEARVMRSVTAFNEQMDVEKPQLIVLDIRLPDGNGISVCNQLKNDPATKHIPVLMMSANESMLANSVCKADGILRKPFRISDFESCILKYLAN